MLELMIPILSPLIYGQLALMLAFAAYLDVRSHRIPNGVTFGGAVAALALQCYFGGWPALG